EPEAAEHLVHLQRFEQRPEDLVFGLVLADRLFVERALRQQRPGDRRDRQQEQQHQCGAHAGQRPPGVADRRPQAQPHRRPAPPGRGLAGRLRALRLPAHLLSVLTPARAGWPRLGHIGSTVSVMKALRTQSTNSPHAPVTSAMPTATSSTPPTIWIVRALRRRKPTPRSAEAEPKASTTNGRPSPMQ